MQRLFTVHCLLVTAYWLLAACGAGAPAPTVTPAASSTPTRTPAPTPTPTATPVPVQYAVVGRARGDYWSAVERGTQAAEQSLALPAGSVAYAAPEQEDAAAQILLVEKYVAQGVRGIAIAPSDARALALSIRQARAAGVWVVTYDSDAPNSERQFFIGTSPRTIGRESANALLRLLANQTGKIALGSTVSDAGAAERIAAFKDVLKANEKFTILDASNDGHDLNKALQAARVLIVNQKDLVGAYGVYDYNGAAWCRVIKETRSASKITLVGFDANDDSIACLQDGALDALVVPRALALGAQAVLALNDLARNGLIATATALKFDLHAPAATWMLDVGVDVISRDGRAGISLGAYAAALDRQMVPHSWSP